MHDSIDDVSAFAAGPTPETFRTAGDFCDFWQKQESQPPESLITGDIGG